MTAHRHALDAMLFMPLGEPAKTTRAGSTTSRLIVANSVYDVVIHEPIRSKLFLAAREQPLLQRDSIQVVWQRPVQANTLGAFDVALHRGRADIQTLADLAVAETLRGQATQSGLTYAGVY
jgi:hypothetical protein